MTSPIVKIIPSPRPVAYSVIITLVVVVRRVAYLEQKCPFLPQICGYSAIRQFGHLRIFIFSLDPRRYRGLYVPCRFFALCRRCR